MIQALKFILVCFLISSQFLFAEKNLVKDVNWLKSYSCNDPQKNEKLLSEYVKYNACSNSLGIVGCGFLISGVAWGAGNVINKWLSRKKTQLKNELLKHKSAMENAWDNRVAANVQWTNIQKAFAERDKQAIIRQVQTLASNDPDFKDALRHIRGVESYDLIRLGTSDNPLNPEHILKTKVLKFEDDARISATALMEAVQRDQDLAKSVIRESGIDLYKLQDERQRDISPNNSRAIRSIYTDIENFKSFRNDALRNKSSLRELGSFARKWGAPALLLVSAGSAAANYWKGKDVVGEAVNSLADPTACSDVYSSNMTVDDECKPVYVPSANIESFLNLPRSEQDSLLRSTNVVTEKRDLCEYYKSAVLQMAKTHQENIDDIPEIKQIDCDKSIKVSFVDSDKFNFKSLDLNLFADQPSIGFEYKGNDRSVRDGLVKLDRNNDEVIQFCYTGGHKANSDRTVCNTPASNNNPAKQRTQKSLQIARYVSAIAQKVCQDPTFTASIKTKRSQVSPTLRSRSSTKK